MFELYLNTIGNGAEFVQAFQTFEACDYARRMWNYLADGHATFACYFLDD